MTTPIKSTTQQFLEIEDIVEDVVILQDGSCVLVMEASAVNFGLLSKDEQEAIIYAFAAFLNSLSFPVQISILSKQMDITDYLAYILAEKDKQKSSKLKEKLDSYYQFIVSLVKGNKVLEKRFFIVIPYSFLELGVKSAKGILRRPKKLPYPKQYILERAKTALYPKRDHVVRQLSRLGLRAKQLTNELLVALFYELYNPESAHGEKVPDGVTQPILYNNKF